MGALKKSNASAAPVSFRVEWPEISLPASPEKFGEKGMSSEQVSALGEWYGRVQLAVNQQLETVAKEITALKSASIDATKAK